MADDRYYEARALVYGAENASTAFVQRVLYIGYNEASSYMERMEAEGFISRANHLGRRQVLANGPAPLRRSAS